MIDRRVRYANSQTTWMERLKLFWKCMSIIYKIGKLQGYNLNQVIANKNQMWWYFQGGSLEPCHLSSSLYYGGQDGYSHAPPAGPSHAPPPTVSLVCWSLSKMPCSALLWCDFYQTDWSESESKSWLLFFCFCQFIDDPVEEKWGRRWPNWKQLSNCFQGKLVAR